MNKKILTIIAATMLTASTAFAAPITDLQDGQTVVGYNYYYLDSNKQKDHSFYLEHALAPKVVLGFEVNMLPPDFPDGDTFDAYVQYKLDNHVRLIAGNRNYTEGTDRLFCGIGANVKLTRKLDGYLSATHSDFANEWQAGVQLNMDYQTSLHVGYKSYKQDNLSTIDGIGIGFSHKF
ncbi:hypothetical protein SPSIL_011860 [Sporomusa silvacetica DSM 10669]|uniref:Outer membrane protein beta-barrel domain-containing protein n=1 Tax=Sporomusa silvacetica DSM 10669 TaxID=1123289 RepID=A0ABZ3IHC4_9FIRM|nr:hypothetical protein [Sporomusa silvacetica]OZC22074.1 hypothetical protein SPSIL_07470 [Sporomusa silvacetica DSM 10669]